MAWIRSQNGELLLNAKLFEYSDKYEMHRLFADGAAIGEFPTKLAVLDEMNSIERWVSTGTNDTYQVTQP